MMSPTARLLNADSAICIVELSTHLQAADSTESNRRSFEHGKFSSSRARLVLTEKFRVKSTPEEENIAAETLPGPQAELLQKLRG